jgi:hypothetical protein
MEKFSASAVLAKPRVAVKNKAMFNLESLSNIIFRLFGASLFFQGRKCTRLLSLIKSLSGAV